MDNKKTVPLQHTKLKVLRHDCGSEYTSTELNNNQQDRQCTYNVTLRDVRAAIVVVEKQGVLHNQSV